MKTLPVLAFALLALVAIAAAPAPTEIAPALVLSDPAPADPAVIGAQAPAPLPKVPPCFDECMEIRAECDAGCSTTQCHRECRDSAIQCLSNC